MITLKFTPESLRVLADLPAIPDRMANGMQAALDRENQFTIARITRNYLSFPKSGPSQPTGLRVQTNRLRAALRAEPAKKTGAATITSSIGDNVTYAAVHEFGFTGLVNVKSFARHVKTRDILVTDSRFKGGHKVIGTGIAFVKAHQRKMNLPGRAFVRRGLADRADNYTRSLSRAVIAASKKP